MKLKSQHEVGFAVNHVSATTKYAVVSREIYIQRMLDRRKETIDGILEIHSRTAQTAELPASAWTTDEIPSPNVTDKTTVLSFANMALNAYILEPSGGDWKDVKGGFNYTEDFGWEKDGLRGHIFADTKNSTVVIGLKGTSISIFDKADTTSHDKENDNLFGSCCCAQGGQYFWKQVCDCQTSTYTCNNTCLTTALRQKSHYYHAARDLYHTVAEEFPNADIWLTGHSLGGVVTSLLGLTYGVPAITFEAFPDALAASRLGLPTPPGYHIGRHQDRRNSAIHHFGHTADPVYMGTCHAASSACTIGGYAFQSQCHTGNTCTYDSVTDLGLRPGISTHSISFVIKDVIEKYDEPPKCRIEEDCTDCYNWKFYESHSSISSSSSSTKSGFSSTFTSKTSKMQPTRTSTCQTPGWWGCLDPSTTSVSTVVTSTIVTTTCLKPGWFRCRDLETTTRTTTFTTSTAVEIITTTTISSTAPTMTITTTTTTLIQPK